jgi:hypothetical protein
MSNVGDKTIMTNNLSVSIGENNGVNYLVCLGETRG